jgi:hypothetical protein
MPSKRKAALEGAESPPPPDCSYGSSSAAGAREAAQAWAGRTPCCAPLYWGMTPASACPPTAALMHAARTATASCLCASAATCAQPTTSSTKVPPRPGARPSLQSPMPSRVRVDYPYNLPFFHLHPPRARAEQANTLFTWILHTEVAPTPPPCTPHLPGAGHCPRATPGRPRRRTCGASSHSARPRQTWLRAGGWTRRQTLRTA